MTGFDALFPPHDNAARSAGWPPLLALVLLTGSGHVLGDEDRFEEFPVQPQPARDVATLKSTLGQIAVVRSLSTRRLRLVKPVADFLEAPRRVVGAGGHQPGH